MLRGRLSIKSSPQTYIFICYCSKSIEGNFHWPTNSKKCTMKFTLARPSWPFIAAKCEKSQNQLLFKLYNWCASQCTLIKCNIVFYRIQCSSSNSGIRFPPITLNPDYRPAINWLPLVSWVEEKNTRIFVQKMDSLVFSPVFQYNFVINFASLYISSSSLMLQKSLIVQSPLLLFRNPKFPRWRLSKWNCFEIVCQFAKKTINYLMGTGQVTNKGLSVNLTQLVVMTN